MGKTFIIAEMSANHNGSKQIGIETIRAAKRAGADAIKLQTYTADTITLDNDKMEFMADSTSVWAGMRLYDLYKQAYTLGSGTKNCFVWPRRKDLSVFHHRLIKLR